MCEIVDRRGPVFVAMPPNRPPQLPNLIAAVAGPLTSTPGDDISAAAAAPRVSPPSALDLGPAVWLASEDDGIPHPSSNEQSWEDQVLRAKKYKIGKVRRVVDASTIQLERGGYASLESVRGAGSTYRLPDCMDYAPSYKLKGLLPKGTAVRMVDSEDVARGAGGVGPLGRSPSTTTPRAWIVREKDGLLVNRELVRTGFALVRRGADAPIPGMLDGLLDLERDARSSGLGIFRSCDDGGDATSGDGGVASKSSNFVAEFEPLDYVTETRYGDDGGRRVLVPRESTASSPPPNPGDTKGCSDFASYEDALGWYERYLPYYGDVARLDRDGDGVPCPGLPHTSVAERYRMKVPNNGNREWKPR